MPHTSATRRGPRSRAGRFAASLGVSLCLAVAGVAAVAPSAMAATITVNETADAYINGDGRCSLREAIIAANTDAPLDACPAGTGDDDVIQLAAAAYPLSIANGMNTDEDLGVRGDLDVLESLTIQGPTTGTATINAMGIDRVMNVIGTATVLNLRGVTLRGGAAPAGTFGGGLAIEFAGVVIERGGVDLNTASNGGGVDISGSNAYPGRLELRRSTVSDNTASGDGGGIRIDQDSAVILDQSTVSGNRADFGDGIHNQGHAALINSTVSGNGATTGGIGGGIYNANQGELTMDNVTLVRNAAGPAAGSGGNLYNANPAAPKVTITNTIIAEPAAGGSCAGNGFTSGGYNLAAPADVDPCFVAGGGGGTDVVGDPMLGPLQDNGGPTATHAIGLASAARDRGATTLLVASTWPVVSLAKPVPLGVVFAPVDQRGAPRPFGPKPDIGAYELLICDGRAVTIWGTAGNDRLIGTAADEVFHGLDGNDVIDGRGGGDRMCGGEGNDRLSGGSGDDRMFGNRGDDTLRPGPGDDYWNGSAGIDTLTFSAAQAAVNVNLGANPDTATGEGADRGTNVENVHGTRFDDTIRGNQFANRLYGRAGQDTIRGAAGDDGLFGGIANDTLFGEAGNDALAGNTGTDTCHQGAGTGPKTSCELP